MGCRPAGAALGRVETRVCHRNRDSPQLQVLLWVETDEDDISEARLDTPRCTSPWCLCSTDYLLWLFIGVAEGMTES